MKFLIAQLITFLSLIIYSNALTCTACNNCHSDGANIIKFGCTFGQNYCFTLKSGTTIRAGCAASCEEDENTTCCDKDNCNSRVANKLTCYECKDCFGTFVNNKTCDYKQTYCYTEQQGRELSAGCAEKCEPGPNKKCCQTNICNNDTKADFSCYNINSLQSNTTIMCGSEDKFCFIEQNGNTVRGGCAKECVDTVNKKCCGTKNCNTPIKSFTCTTCKNCLYSAKIISTVCGPNDKFCQVERYGAFNTTVDAGCVASCKPNAESCCDTNDCNPIPEALFCNACKNCSYNETISTKCLRDETFCFTEKVGNTANAGCAISCSADSNKECCKTKNCNTVPTPFTCNGCTNCSFTTVRKEVCGVNDKFCYVDEKGKDVTAGCTQTCQPSATRTCCDSNNCNKLPDPFRCYSCPSCKYFAPTLRKCDYLDTFCYKETNSSGSFIEKGCASKCEETAYKKCCTTTGCNHSSSIIGLNFIYLFSLALFQFVFIF